MNARFGWGVAIRRKDGSQFLCASSEGILPAVWTLAQRKRAVGHKRELVDAGFACRVVRVAFSDPVIADGRVR